MKRIYVVTTQTQTVVGKAIRTVTAKVYNHNSISFDENLTECYGMGRSVVHNPFSAQLIREKFLFHPHYENTDIVVTYIEVPDASYDKLKSKIEHMYEHGESYRYNYVGFVGYFVGKPLRLNENRFNCSQFVGHAFAAIDIQINGKEPDALLPLDFVESDQLTLLYEGSLDRYLNDHGISTLATEQNNN